MFEPRPNPIGFPVIILAICLSLLAGCGGGDNTASAATPDSSVGTPAAASPSTIVPAAGTPAAAAPLAPTGLAAIASDAQVNLAWSASIGATSYSVKRSATTGGPYTQLATVTSPSYTDAAVSGGATYYYVIAAINSQGVSGNSAQSFVTLGIAITIPSVPVDFGATAGNAQASLTWSASSGATSYHVKRATVNGGPYSQVGAPTSGSYTDSPLANGTTYFYVVTAVNSAGESANSAQVSATPVVPVSNPPPTTFGSWINVTPSGVSLSNNLSCGNYGTETVQPDPAHPSNLYTEFNCQGIWKSTDYGATWTGPINTGANGAAVTDCAGGITISPTSTASVPTIYESCIRGSGTGFWKSVDGGVNWTRYVVAPSGASRQDYYPAVVDPYDQNHLLMAGHEMDFLVESVDGGQNWSNVSLASGMLENGGTGAIFFINTGNASTTRGTWMWMGQQSGGIYGTWRTTNRGGTWAQVDKNEHPHGSAQIYQPDSNGVVYMAGAYSALGWGVLRSSDYGQTWTHVGTTSNETVVFGTSKNVYSMYGYPIGAGGINDPAFEVAAQPGTGSWTTPAMASGLTQGSAQVSVVNDGTHNIFVGAMWNSGVWRYVEP